MDDLSTTIIAAFLAFILGLLADAIKGVVQRQKRRLTWSVQKEPIVAVSSSLPVDVRSKLPAEQKLKNIARFELVGKNTGTQLIQDAIADFVLNKDSELLASDISTTPPVGVTYSSLEKTNHGKLKCKGITLERKQSIIFSLFLISDTDPEMNVYWSGGGGDVEWIESTSGVEAFNLEENMVKIIWYYILATFLPSLFIGIVYILTIFLPEESMAKTQIGGIGIGQTIGTLISFYFYFKIIPHATMVIRWFVGRKTYST